MPSVKILTAPAAVIDFLPDKQRFYWADGFFIPGRRKIGW
jgi:hypothetical protein